MSAPKAAAVSPAGVRPRFTLDLDELDCALLAGCIRRARLLRQFAVLAGLGRDETPIADRREDRLLALLEQTLGN